MSKDLASKNNGQFDPADRKTQGPVPDDGKSQVICKKAQGPNDEPAAPRLIVEDEDWIRLEYDRLRLKEALGIDDDGFCEGILQQLDQLLSIEEGPYNEKNFAFVLSVVKSPQPVDKLHAMLLIQMAVCQLSVMRQSEILLKPINYEPPYDVAVALHRAAWDTGRMEKQKIRIDDQPVRQSGERMVTRLMQTYAMQLETSTGYRKASQQVSASATGEALSRDGTAAIRQKAHKNAAPRSSRGPNGSRQSAAHSTSSSNQQLNSITLRKSNGRASS